jgi:hypothetical protein
MTTIKALDIAIRRLTKSRMPTVLAAALTLSNLREEMVDREESAREARIVAFRSKLPRVA